MRQHAATSPYLDERLRAGGLDDAQKQRRPARGFIGSLRGHTRSLLLLVTALTVISTIPLLLLGRPSAAGDRGPADGQNLQILPLISMKPAPNIHLVDEASRADVAQQSSSTLSSALPAAAAAAAPRYQPYSAQADCRRPYDRPTAGQAFARCGRSCCRSHAGIPCYYSAKDGLCDESSSVGGPEAVASTTLVGEAGGEPGDGDSAAAASGGGGGPVLSSASASRGVRDDEKEEDGGGDDDDDERPPPSPPATLSSSTMGARSSASLSSSSSVYTTASTVDTAAIAAAAAATASHESLQRIVPMLMPEGSGGSSTRRPRMMRYPLFNLTWTRGAPPPRSDGWSPTEGQRRRLPERDLKERYYASCAIVGSSGTLRRSGYGRFIDAHEMVMRFNGAPAGGGYADDVGSRTTMAVLADISATECTANKARQPWLDPHASSRMEGHLLQEPAPSWRQVSHCAYYPQANPLPSVVFLPKRDGVRRLLEYALDHASVPVYIRSDAMGEEVDAQVGAFQDDTSHPTSGFNGVCLALHICETIDLYGFGSPRDKFYSPPRAEKAGSQHLYRTEMRWLLGLEMRFPDRVRLWR